MMSAECTAFEIIASVHSKVVAMFCGRCQGGDSVLKNVRKPSCVGDYRITLLVSSTKHG